MSDIIIWLGSGFAFAVGMCSGIAVCRIASTPKKAAEEAREHARKTLEMLEERNAIGERQVYALSKIAHYTEKVKSEASQ